MREYLVILMLAVAYVWVSLTAEVHGEQAFLPVVMQQPTPAPTPTLLMSSTAWVSPVGTPTAQ